MLGGYEGFEIKASSNTCGIYTYGILVGFRRQQRANMQKIVHDPQLPSNHDAIVDRFSKRDVH